jgi:hypothetical protein
VADFVVPENQSGKQALRDFNGEPLQRLSRRPIRYPYLGAGRRRFLSPAERARHQIGLQIGDTHDAVGDSQLTQPPASRPVRVPVRVTAEPHGTPAYARAQGFAAPAAYTHNIKPCRRLSACCLCAGHFGIAQQLRARTVRKISAEHASSFEE